MDVIHKTTLERQQGGFTHEFIVRHGDLTETATATAQALTLFTLPIGTLVRNVATRLTTAFQDSADSANNTTPVTVGDAGSAARYLASQELNVNGTEVYNKAGTGTNLAYDAAGSLIATFTAPATGKTLAALDTGEVHIFAEIVNLKELAGS